MEHKSYFKGKSYSRKKKRKTKTLEEREYLARIKNMPCCICGSVPSDAHHVRINTGIGLKASDYDTIPLCKNHHQGKEGFHTLGRRAWEERYSTQQELLEQIKERIKC